MVPVMHIALGNRQRRMTLVYTPMCTNTQTRAHQGIPSEENKNSQRVDRGIEPNVRKPDSQIAMKHLRFYANAQ